MRKAFTTVVLALSATGLMFCAAIGAGPAFASTAGSPVNVSGTVNQSLSIGGLASTITFPAGNPGQTVTAHPAEGYDVQTNSPAGYTLSITPQSPTFGGDDNANLSVVESGTAPGVYTFANGETPLVISTTSSATSGSGDIFAEDWKWAIPAGAPSGGYSEVFVYTALGNSGS